jgi:hypothetical protein
MDGLRLQIKRSGVISVCGDGPRKSIIIKKLYRSIMLQQDELRFGKQRWVPVVSHPLDILDFLQHLNLDSESGFFYGDSKEEQLSNCLVVIDGLQSTDEWDKIKSSTFLVERPKCCIVVVTDNLAVAEYCVDGNRDRLVEVSEADQGKVCI